MNKEEILYNEIYERTKDFGRTHFIKEIMRLQREYQQLKEIEKEHQRINGDLRVEIKELKDRIDKALDILDNYSVDYTSLMAGYENANDNIVNEVYSILKDGLGGKNN